MKRDTGPAAEKKASGSLSFNLSLAGVAAGAAVGVILVVALGAGVGFFVYRRSVRRKDVELQSRA